MPGLGGHSCPNLTGPVRDMFPCSPPLDHGDVRWRCGERTSYFWIRKSACADESNGIWSEFGLRQLVAARRIASAFCIHVGDIVSLSTGKQMSVVDAERCIAMVADFQAGGDDAVVCRFPSPHMRTLGDSLNCEPSIRRAFRLHSGPKEAPCCRVTFRVERKSFRHRHLARGNFSSNVWHSLQLLWTVVAGQIRGDVSASSGSPPYSTAGACA